MTLHLWGLLLFCVLVEAAREVCFKLGADGASLRETLTKPIIGLGLLCWVVETATWTAVLTRVPLSIAFPLMSLSYVTIVGAGALFLHEKVNLRHAAGALLITAGVACVGVTGI